MNEEWKRCPFLVEMRDIEIGMESLIIGYTCKAQCVSCQASTQIKCENDRLKEALEQIAHLRNLNPEMKATKFSSCVEDDLRNFYCTMGDIAIKALSNAPDMNNGSITEMNGKERESGE